MGVAMLQMRAWRSAGYSQASCPGVEVCHALTRRCVSAGAMYLCQGQVSGLNCVGCEQQLLCSASNGLDDATPCALPRDSPCVAATAKVMGPVRYRGCL